MKKSELKQIIKEEIQKLHEDKLKKLQDINAVKFIKDLHSANKRLRKLMKAEGYDV